MKTVAVAVIIALALWAGVLEVKKHPDRTSEAIATQQEAAR